MKVSVTTRPGNRVSINNQQRTTIRSVGLTGGSGGATSLNQLTDIDASDAEDNEVLVYDETTGKYVVKPIPIVDGGTF